MSRNDMLSYETMRHVALEIVQLGRDIPEDQWFEDATHDAASLIRRLCEEAYDEGRQGELSSLGEAEVAPGADPPRQTGIVAVRRAKLLDRRSIRFRTGGVPVGGFLRNLETLAPQSLRRAVEPGLVPSGLDLAGGDDSIAILRFTQPRLKSLMREREINPRRENHVVR